MTRRAANLTVLQRLRRDEPNHPLLTELPDELDAWLDWAEPCIDCGRGSEHVEIFGFYKGVDYALLHCCTCEQEWLPGHQNPRIHPTDTGDLDRREAQAASLLHAVHQRVDNAGDMGCPQVTVADAVSYWVVRFAHDQDAASELADAWDDGVGEEYPGVSNPWRDYAPTPTHGTSPDAANAINRLRDIAARHREV